MRIAILGTRGIPNPYGGYEQYAEFLALGFVKRGHNVIVYNSHNHSFQESEWNNISIVHIQDSEFKFGSLGRFLFNVKCIQDVKTRNCDVVLQLDYTALSLWNFLIPKRITVITYMDNLASKKTAHAKLMGMYLNYAEKLAAKYSDHLISDSEIVRDYLKDIMGKPSTLIPYAVDLFKNPDVNALKNYKVEPYEYDLLMSKFTIHNDLEIILNGVVAANLSRPFLIVGNYNNMYGHMLKEKYKAYGQIRFLGDIYNNRLRDNLRYFSNLYFHSNTTSSTNVLLLHAMATKCLISARNNILNSAILGKEGFYFNNAKDVEMLLCSVARGEAQYQEYLISNCTKIKDTYNWDRVLAQYEDLFIGLHEKKMQHSKKLETTK